ncbi:MAG TPA: HAD hydrolase-like protein [Anaeromyxobacteraceae bacterium]|nr:HAD hydrolase-like protein [Anaeromyxobacteraceae bacterium]
MKLCVFDLDGTLVDSREDLFLAVEHALSELGLPPRTREEVVSYVGDGAVALVSRAIAPREHLLESALALWREHYSRHLLDHTRLYPGIAAVIGSARVPLAVHTNKPGAMARRILDGLGVLGRFSAVVGGDEAARKPDPSGLLGICSRLGVAPGDAVLVGDSVVDHTTAVAAGVRFVPVSWGFVPLATLSAAGATGFVQDAAGLLPFVGAA